MDVSSNSLALQTRLVALNGLLRRHSVGAAAVLLFLAGLATRLYRLGAQSLWLDEGGTWAEVTGRTGKGWLALVGELFSPNAAYPLYHLLLKAWVTLAGDSEWALRFPSALAGAAALLVLYLAANELRARDQAITGLTDNVTPSPLPAVATALIVLTSPFALWLAQDAKVYSLLLLCVALLLWALLRVVRFGTRRDWLALLLVSLIALFVHRLTLLALAAVALALMLAWPRLPLQTNRSTRFSSIGRSGIGVLALLLAVAGVVGAILAVRGESRGGTGHVAAGPVGGLWLSLQHFALDRGNINGWLDVPLLVWMVPALLLTLWGLVLLVRDARRDPAAIVILCMLIVPLVLFAFALAFAQLFEARYVTVAFPAWVLTVAYPFAEQRTKNKEQMPKAWFQATLFSVLCSLLVVQVLVIFQPQHGLFSGAAVKEQWREGIAEIARRAHPDDLVILHPYYVQPLWAYYAPRVTPDPLPQIETFNLLGQGYCRDIAQDNADALIECYRRNYEEAFDKVAYGKKRMLMLIAPDHARTIDPPLTAAELRAKGYPATEDDKYGLLGLRFQYAEQQRTWPCGGTGNALIGVEVMCAEFPSFYRETGAASIPQPAVPLDATFGGELRLRGFTLAPLGGAFRPGGSLPITLFWEAAKPPTRDYHMFLHLCRDCSLPPLANDDAAPLNGYPLAGRTTTWIVGDPVHDERSIRLPPDLAPGTYTLYLGVYPEGDPSEAARLAVESSSTDVIGGTRLALGEVSIGPP